jgi:hypothetical protein
MKDKKLPTLVDYIKWIEKLVRNFGTEIDYFAWDEITKVLPSREVSRVYTQEEAQDMASMIDGVYETVELWEYSHKDDSPYNVKWAKEWREKARKYGAGPDW